MTSSEAVYSPDLCTRNGRCASVRCGVQETMPKVRVSGVRADGAGSLLEPPFSVDILWGSFNFPWAHGAQRDSATACPAHETRPRPGGGPPCLPPLLFCETRWKGR